MERQASAPCRQSVLSARDKTILHALLIGRGCNVTLPQCTAGFHYPTENLDCVDGEAHLLEGSPRAIQALPFWVGVVSEPAGEWSCPMDANG